ncbi:MAG: S16 family serine protease [Candidatus Thermoplasmatota archaeon]|nr:S16 family serine protease [Candidatus Thermoplasmatota archaeon]
MQKAIPILLSLMLAVPALALNDSGWVEIYAPAVAQTEEGMVGALSTIRIRVEPGGGHVFVDTFPLTQIDMQSSARMAASVACSVSNKSLSDYDFFVVVRGEAQMIGGTSAGGAMTVAMVSALNDLPLRKDVMMTGTISPDGSIGPVSGIPEKMEAAREAGAKVFLLPEGQAEYSYTITNTTQIGPLVITSQRPAEMNLIEHGKSLGLTVKEVSNIREAVKEFTGVELKQPSAGSIDMSEYNQLMKEHAEGLEKEARASYAAAQSVSAPDDYLNESRNRLVDGINQLSQRRYYTAASSLFESMIYSGYVTNYNKYRTDPEKGIEEIGNEIERIESKIRNETEEYNIVYLQCFGAAEERIMEAEENFEIAYNLLQNGSIADGIFALSYAAERADSAEWWFDIAKKMHGGEELSEEYVSSLALSAMDTAEETSIYAQFSASSELLSLLLQASDELNRAKDAVNKSYTAGAVVLASKALALSELVIELGARGMSNESLNITKENAKNAVARAQSSGINPILALAYLESAESYESTDIAQSLIDYKYAECIARMSGAP